MAYSVFPPSHNLCLLNLLIAASGFLTYPGNTHVLRALLVCSKISEEELLRASNSNLEFKEARIDPP